MTSTVLDVWNQALAAAGGKGRVQTLNEASRERELCSLFYNQARDCVQESAYWAPCRGISRLALLAEAADPWVESSPIPGYLFSYALPTDYLRAWALTDYSTFEIGFDQGNNRLVLYSNTEDAILEYCRKNESVATWSPGMKNAAIFGLAGYICVSLGSKDLSQTLWVKANKYLIEGAAYSMNEPTTPFDTIPDWLSVRGGLPSISPTRFIFPQSSGFLTNG